MYVYRRKPKPGQPQNLTYHFKYQIRGQKPVRKTSGTTIKSKAETIAKADYAKALMIAKGVITDADVDVPAVTLDALSAEYLAWATLDHPKTVKEDRRIVPHFVARVGGGNVCAHAIAPKTIDDWRVRRARDKTRRGTFVKATTINREFSVICGMFSKAVEWKYLTASPFADMRKLEPDEYPVRILTADELERAFTKLPEPYNLFCEVTYRTLARLGEVRRLRAEHVTIDRQANGHAIAALTKLVKGGRWKRVRIPLPLAQKLRGRVLSDDQEFIFPDFAGDDGGATSAEFTPLFRAAKLKCTHHAFRHTGITRMLEGGVSPRAIQEHAGWSSLQQLERYGRVLDLEFARAVEVTDDFLVRARAEAAAAANGTTGGVA